MELKEIKELVKILEKSNLEELYIKNGDFEINLIKNREREIVNIGNVGGVAQLPTQQVPVQPAIQQNTQTQAVNNSSSSAEGSKEDNLIEIKAPMIGTFYRAPSPDSPPYVKEGDKVNEDTIVCIIEAMKLFNEIKAEVKGTIVKVLVNDGEPVEYGQTLFLVKP